MNFSQFFSGTPEQTKQFQNYTPTQNMGMDQILSQALSGLGGMQNKFDFAPIEQQARQGFSQKTIPSIMERFTSMGGQRSGAFNRTLGQAGSDLETNLASLRSNYGLQQQGLDQNLLLNLLQTGLKPRFENLYIPRQPGAFEGAAQGFGQSVSPIIQLLSMLFGGK